MNQINFSMLPIPLAPFDYNNVLSDFINGQGGLTPMKRLHIFFSHLNTLYLLLSQKTCSTTYAFFVPFSIPPSSYMQKSDKTDKIKLNYTE